MTPRFAVEYRDPNTGHTHHSTPRRSRAQAEQHERRTQQHALSEGETTQVVEWDGNAWPKTEVTE